MAEDPGKIDDDSSESDIPLDKLAQFKNIERGVFGKGKANIIYDLDIPALRVSDSHKRVMGYWIITWISFVKESLIDFFKNGSIMQLVIGIPLTAASYDALIASAATTDASLKSSLRNEFYDLLDNPKHWLDSDASDLFIRMIASDQFQVKLLPNRGSKENHKAEHSKIRIYTCEDEIYSLSGSANDTYSGHFSLKEHSGPASISWSLDEVLRESAREAPSLFKADWDHECVLELDQSTIPVLLELQKKHQMDQGNEESDYPPHFREIENRVKKLAHKNSKAIFYLPSEKNHIEKLHNEISKGFSSESIEFISIEDDENSDELFVYSVYCNQRKVRTCTFAESAAANHVVTNQLKSCISGNPVYSRDDFEQIGREHHSGNDILTPNYIWSGIYISLGLEIPELEPDPEPEPPTPDPIPSNPLQLWSDDIFQYPYDEVPGDLTPCEHQLDALIKWKDNAYRGILQHATGTYKTATGLCAAAHLLSKDSCDFVLISSPYTEVSKQWLKLSKMCFKDVTIVPCWGTDYPEWKPAFRAAISASRKSSKKTLAIFVNASLFGKKNESKHAIEQLGLLGKGNHDWGVVADEMHSWISNSADSRALNFMQILNDHCTYRLGLSARVDKRGDENNLANSYVKGWFSLDLGTSKKMIDDFPLERAIREGFLRKYDYQIEPLDVYVSDDYVSNHGTSKSIEHAHEIFEKHIHEYVANNSFGLIAGDANRLLIYTGPTKRIATRLVKAIQENRATLDSSEIRKFTSDEKPKEREQILDDFKSSIVKILVAIKCLDEGVNLPIADSAIMALSSDDDDRQWIQRRGRILRRIRGENKVAKIIDFYPIFHVNDATVKQSLHGYQEEEFTRIHEFSQNATKESRRSIVAVFRKIQE
ncbi:MAG: helicase-related protein [Candidatus Thermoplasmatota archaeon]|nr:helicase-related protein [Candidatus Thermoplasmatota archaeon]